MLNLNNEIAARAIRRVENETAHIEKKIGRIYKRYSDIVAEFREDMPVKDRLIHWVHSMIKVDGATLYHENPQWHRRVSEIIEMIESTSSEYIERCYHHLLGTIGLDISDTVYEDDEAAWGVNLTLISYAESEKNYEFRLPSDEEEDIISFDMIFDPSDCGNLSEDVWALLIYYVIDIVYQLRVNDVIDFSAVKGSTRCFLRHHSSLYYVFRYVADI